MPRCRNIMISFACSTDVDVMKEQLSSGVLTGGRCQEKSHKPKEKGAGGGGRGQGE